MTFGRFSTRLAFSSALALGLLAASGGCSGGAASQPAVSVSSAATRAVVAPSTHGPIRMMGQALGDVPLEPSQRTEIEKLASDAESRQAVVRTARQDLMVAIASQIAAGAVDRAALQPKVDALVATVQTVEPADRAAIERLHAVLAADQRTAFVNALEARIHERMADAHDKHSLRQWAGDLQLTADQRAELKTLFKSQFEAMRQRAQGDGGPHRGAMLFEAF